MSLNYKVLQQNSRGIPPFTGLKTLQEPFFLFISLLSGQIIPESIYGFELRGATILELPASMDDSPLPVYFVAHIASYLDNESGSILKRKKNLYVIYRAPQIYYENMRAAWEVSPAVLYKLLNIRRLESLRRCAGYAGLIEKVGYDKLTKNQKYRWAGACKLFRLDPTSLESGKKIISECAIYEEGIPLFRKRVEEDMERIALKRRGRSPEINSDFRRFRN